MKRTAGTDDLERIRALIRRKEEDYRHLNFSYGQNVLLRVFADLAQELDTIQDFYRLCVAAPGECLGLDCALYLHDDIDNEFRLACSASAGVPGGPVPPPPYLRVTGESYDADGAHILPIRRTEAASGQDAPVAAGILGLFVVKRGAGLADADLFFLDKFVNRIAVTLHSRLLAQQNIRHLKFINGLVMDIEHNVIVPNMYFRHLFNNLKKSVAEIAEIEVAMAEFKAQVRKPDDACDAMLDRIGRLHQQLVKQHHELQEHHTTTSLFLESLFRRDHFQQGHLVLRPRYCKVEEEIIAPQLEHFASRFAARGIAVEPPVDMGGEELLLVVDVGLLSQVYANFFSNALKYVEEIIDHRGRPRKAMTYGREFVANYFGPSRHGIKLNVFTTGRHLDRVEAASVFDEGYRSDQFRDQPGSGHGLSFVKQVVDIHGGVVGYEPTEEGNNFYFVLPLPATESALSVIVGPPRLP
ncbi:MAG: ATP-binding protein [Desulfobulbaceae bacterium]|nr:ATP-binding protein [Desulfobulbaceae bacterium]